MVKGVDLVGLDSVVQGLQLALDLKKKKGVPESRWLLIERDIGKIAQKWAGSNDEYIAFRELSDSYEIRPSLQTISLCSMIGKNLESSFKIFKKDLKDDIILDEKSFRFIMHPKNVIQLEELYEMVFAGYYGSVAAHNRFRAIVKSMSGLVYGYNESSDRMQRRFVSLSHALKDGGYDDLSRLASKGVIDNLETDVPSNAFKCSYILMSYMVTKGLIKVINPRQYQFLNKKVTVSNMNLSLIEKLSVASEKLISTILQLSCSSLSLDITTRKVKKYMILIGALSETCEEENFYE